MNILHSCIETRLAQLPAGLRDHIERARVVGRELAARHDVDADAIDVGITAHDLARAMDDKALLDEAELLRIDVMPIERQAPILLHGPIAAVWLSRGCEPVDTRAIEAVRWHTTGHPDMDDVGKAVFLADKLDPQKVEALPYLTKVETLASCDMDSAILEYLDREIEHLVGRGLVIHPASVDLRNEIVVRRVRIDHARVNESGEE
tara:strand:- start:97 stop:711 length:615 start_codon:yes stop_codon:yes gene_type:complete